MAAVFSPYYGTGHEYQMRQQEELARLLAAQQAVSIREELKDEMRYLARRSQPPIFSDTYTISGISDVKWNVSDNDLILFGYGNYDMTIYYDQPEKRISFSDFYKNLKKEINEWLSKGVKK